MTVETRAARADDTTSMRTVERAAGERFRDVGLDAVADDEPPPAEVLLSYIADGRAWVAIGDDGSVVGYVIADVVDGAGHVEQVSVHPDAQGRGIGRRLIDEVVAWATGAGFDRLTLCTFRDVEWNRPLYEHLRFVVLADDQIGPELRAIVVEEAAHGLDPATRVCMRRLLRG